MCLVDLTPCKDRVLIGDTGKIGYMGRRNFPQENLLFT